MDDQEQDYYTRKAKHRDEMWPALGWLLIVLGCAVIVGWLIENARTMGLL